MKQTLIIPFKSLPQPRPTLKRNSSTAYYGSQSFMDFKLKLTNFLRCSLNVVNEYPIYILVKYYFKLNNLKKFPNSDIDNHYKILVDCLVQSRIIKDDNMNYVKGVLGKVEDNENEMFEIVLTNELKARYLELFLD